MFSAFRPVGVLFPFLWRAFPAAPLRIVLSFGCLIASKACLVAVPFFYRDIIDRLAATSFVTSTPLLAVLGLLAAYGSVRLASTFFSEMRDGLFIPVEQRGIRTLSLTIFKHLHSLSLRFHLDRKTGSLIQVIDRGTRGIETFFRFFLFNLCPSFLEFILVIVVISALYHVLFSLILILTLGVYIWATFRISSWRIGLMRQANDAINQNNAHAVDSLIMAKKTWRLGLLTIFCGTMKSNPSKTSSAFVSLT